MSFEGCKEFLCKKGHLYVSDVYESDPEMCDCESPFIWFRIIDETNGSPKEVDKPFAECSADEIPALKILMPFVTSKCETCGHVSVVSEVSYIVPEDHGHKLS